MICNIHQWKEWDRGLEDTEVMEQVKNGIHFILKPKGWGQVRMTVDVLTPFKLIDIAHLFLARMRITHTFYVGRHGHTSVFQKSISGP